MGLASDLRPIPWIYWTDLLGSAAAGWGLFAASLTQPPGSAGHVAATVGASIALLRAAYFVHEISHIPRRSLPGFELAWHLVAGLPLLIGSLMIGAHKYHHRVSTYGTTADPEYAPIARWSRPRLALDLATMLLVPPALALRWGVIGPVSWIVPSWRAFVVRHMSTLAINPRYEREAPTAAEWRAWRVQEAALAAIVGGVAGATVAGYVPAAALLQWWLVAGLALLLNEVRTWVAHDYAWDPEARSGPAAEGGADAFEAQIRDTITLDGWFLVTDLLAPVGDRYHAAHHRYPAVPYHHLPELHRRLLAELPPDAPYRGTIRRGLLDALATLWRGSARRSPPPDC